MLRHSIRKKFQGRVFCEFWHHKCCYPHLVKRYCQETSQQEVRDIILFQKTQNHDQSCCCHGEKNEPVCFSGKFKAVTIQLSLGENMSFAISPQFQDSQKHVSCNFRANELSIILIKLYTWEGEKKYFKMEYEENKGELHCVFTSPRYCWKLAFLYIYKEYVDIIYNSGIIYI